LHVPDLDQRRSDIPSLFLNLAAQAAARYSKATPDVPADLLARMATQEWPGNVRELRNAADRFVLGLDPTEHIPTGDAATTLAQKMADHERALIIAALTAQGGSLKQTYEALGMSRKALYEKMQKYGLSKSDTEPSS